MTISDVILALECIGGAFVLVLAGFACGFSAGYAYGHNVGKNESVEANHETTR